MAEIDDSSVTDHVDITVTPKTTYYYKVMVLTTSDLHGLSEEVDATTPAGMDYPFLDDGEAPGPPGRRTRRGRCQMKMPLPAPTAGRTRPAADYADNIASQSLTLVSPIDLTSSSSPVLSFIHHWTFAAGDSGNVEISTNGGSSWTLLSSYSNGTLGRLEARTTRPLGL